MSDLPKLEIEKLTTKNPLEEMFARQAYLEEKVLGVDLGKYEFDIKGLHRELSEFLTCISAEVEEARDLLNWKPWKKSIKPFDREEFKYELVDIQHFLISLAWMVGINWSEFYEAFLNKNQENLRRQKEGY